MTIRTGEYDARPWSYRCFGCNTWGHGFATDSGARRGSNQHRCGRIQYNEVKA